jgi:hypothetical protein
MYLIFGSSTNICRHIPTLLTIDNNIENSTWRLMFISAHGTDLVGIPISSASHVGESSVMTSSLRQAAYKHPTQKSMITDICDVTEATDKAKS